MQLNQKEITAIRDRFPFRAEADSSAKLDCAVCALEGKGAGKAIIRADGSVTCFRFAGLGAETAAHLEAMRGVWREACGLADEPRAPAAYLSHTLSGGQITLELSAPETRTNKRTVTARNCTSVLHVDLLNPADAVARAKFVKALSLPEADANEATRALIELADRAATVDPATNDEPKPAEPVRVSFLELDGRVYEQVAGNRFARYDPASGAADYVTRIEGADGAVYLPDAGLETTGIYLASGVDEYGTEAQLDAVLDGFVSKYLDVPERERRLSVQYIKLTYIVDRLQETPYLRAVGPRGNGKSRFAFAVGLSCRRPFMVLDPSPASLFRITDAYKPTLVIDEANFNSGSDDFQTLMCILNAGYQRVARVPRMEKGADGNFIVKLYDPFGCKIISGLKLTDSAAFESRAVRVSLQKTHRKDIPFRLSTRMLREAEALRNKLTLWRLRNLNRDWETLLDQAEAELKAHAIEPRYIQIGIPLYALIASETLKSEFVSMLKSRDEQDAEELTQTLEGEIVAAIHALLFTAGEGGTMKLLDADNAPEDGKPHEALTIEAITDTINADLPDKKKHDVKWVGKQIRKLELRAKEVLRRASTARKKSAVVFVRTRLSFLFALYSLPVPAGFSSDQSDQHGNANGSNNLRWSDGNTADSRNESHPTSLNHSKTSHLQDWSDWSDEKAGKESECLNEGVPNTPAEHCWTPVSVPAFVALDTETEPFDKKRGITPRNAKMIGLALCHDGQQADYETDGAAWPFLMPEAEQCVVFHHAKFDLSVLERAGLPVPSTWEDTLIAAHLLDENTEHGLKPLAKRLLGADVISFKDAEQGRLLDPDIFNEYARNDARFTWRLWELFQPQLEAQGLMRLYELEKRVVTATMTMEANGVQLDMTALRDLGEYLRAEQTLTEQRIYEAAGCRFDIHSPAKTAVILYDKLGLACAKQTGKGARSVAREALQEIEGEHEAVRALLHYRQLDKLASAFVKTLPAFADEHGRIHADFDQFGAKSGRFSCRQPNLQQVPSRSELGKRLRSCFVAASGNKLIVADWSQMELRILAHFSRDAALLQAYNGAEATDLHTLTAAKMFGVPPDAVTKEQRSVAKMINFGIAYGITPIGLANRLKASGVETSESQCERFVNEYFKNFSGVKRFLDQTGRTLRKQGYVTTLGGRRRRLRGNTAREIRQAQNFVIQGTGADLAKFSLCRIHETLPEGARLVSMIHDEIVVEASAEQAAEVCAMMVEVMETKPRNFAVPLKVDAHIVERWSEAK